jgi:predicted transposase/invertase (TIGR01784 family)
MKTLLYRFRSARELKRLVRETAAEGKPLSILHDAVFKAMLTSNNDDSREALRSLLSACIRRKVSAARVINNDLVPAHLDAKTVRLDVHVTFNDGETANLEMQMSKSGDNLKDRAAFHTAMLQASQQSRGRQYQEIKRVYQIFFINDTLFPDSDKLPRRYSYREEAEHDRLTEATEIILYELPKLKKKLQDILASNAQRPESQRPEAPEPGSQKPLPEDEKWCMYMKYRHVERAQPLIEELCRKEEGIMRAERAVEGISRDYLKAIRKMNIIKNEMDRNQRIYDREKRAHTKGLTEGRAEGLEEGRSEGKLEVARKMKEMGDSVEKIGAVTGLSSETIEEL